MPRYEYLTDTIEVTYPDGLEIYCAIEAMPSSGFNTDDATAVSSDIRKPKTAYVAVGKVTGTIEDYTGATGTL